MKNICPRPGAKELRVPMTWTDGLGLIVTQNILFLRAASTPIVS